MYILTTKLDLNCVHAEDQERIMSCVNVSRERVCSV